jgi:hypothetical protein
MTNQPRLYFNFYDWMLSKRGILVDGCNGLGTDKISSNSSVYLLVSSSSLVPQCAVNKILWTNETVKAKNFGLTIDEQLAIQQSIRSVFQLFLCAHVFFPSTHLALDFNMAMGGTGGFLCAIWFLLSNTTSFI